MFRLLIVGATGLVGSKALAMALQDPRITQVIAVSRRAIKPHPKLENHVLDFDNLPLVGSYWSVDAALCALGTTKRETSSKAMYHKIDVEYPLAVAKRVKSHGAKSFAIVSSAGAAVNSPFAYLARKGEVEALLAQLNFSSLTIVRPSFIAGKRAQSRPTEIILSWVMRALEPTLPKRWRIISADRIARTMLDSVLNPKAGINTLESEAI